MTKRPYSIAIADDDPDDRDFFCAGLLRSFPQMTVVAFADGAHLLEYLNTRPAAEIPCGIILDYRMPALSGADVLAAIGRTARYASMSKVVWSSSALQKEIDECLGLGACRWIVKPATDAELDALIHELRPLFFGNAAPA